MISFSLSLHFVIDLYHPTKAVIRVYKKLPGGREVVQVAKDALTMINSVLMVGASARLRAENNIFRQLYDGSDEKFGDPTALNSRVSVDRNRTARPMVQIGGGAI